MLSFIGRRFFQVIPTLLGVVLVTFFLMRLIPGDPTAMIGGQTISDEVRNRLRAEWHLDDPPLMSCTIMSKACLRVTWESACV